MMPKWILVKDPDNKEVWYAFRVEKEVFEDGS